MKIVTYNIHRGQDAKKIDTLNEMILYFKMNNPDIICLQEVLLTNHNDIIQELKLNGYYLANVKLINNEFGISIYCRENIKMAEGIHLHSKKEQRGFIHLKIYINNKLVNIINTHLGLDEEERKIQIKEILNYTENMRGKVFICGDFNQINVEMKNYYDSSMLFDCYNIETFKASKSRIDYIFISKNIRVHQYKVDFIDFSDHYPVVLECKI